MVTSIPQNLALSPWPKGLMARVMLANVPPPPLPEFTTANRFEVLSSLVLLSSSLETSGTLIKTVLTLHIFAMVHHACHASLVYRSVIVNCAFFLTYFKVLPRVISQVSLFFGHVESIVSCALRRGA